MAEPVAVPGRSARVGRVEWGEAEMDGISCWSSPSTSWPRGQLCHRSNGLTGPRPIWSSREPCRPATWAASEGGPHRLFRGERSTWGWRRLPDGGRSGLPRGREAISYNDKQLRIWSGTKTQVGRRIVEHRPSCRHRCIDSELTLRLFLQGCTQLIQPNGEHKTQISL